ncbi:hypothetical protein AJ78_04269 [Emergomyces pasteurianus Ep9510]|uniref:Uncharacterized protein n=1 Tax=Emergomyces pasteurianus Ep9510 TaxID=1447872 RepID=A0A1J9PGC7_9EURO|nr:hypothetical protein AJ78_04269 [Emergomyces pasteurianus Ep9510]
MDSNNFDDALWREVLGQWGQEEGTKWTPGIQEHGLDVFTDSNQDLNAIRVTESARVDSWNGNEVSKDLTPTENHPSSESAHHLSSIEAPKPTVIAPYSHSPLHIDLQEWSEISPIAK